MAERLVAEGGVAGLEAVTAFNRPVFQAYAEIVATIRQRLGEQAAGLFARPELAGDQISWFTDRPGEIRRWLDLAPADRVALEPARAALDGQLAGLVSSFGASGINTRDGNLAHVLEAALVAPGLEHLYLVGGQPVLAFWGFRGAGQQGVSPLRTPLPAPPAEPTPPPLPPPRRRMWPWLLALAALVLLALLLWWHRPRPLATVPPPAPPPVEKPEPVAPPIAPPVEKPEPVPPPPVPPPIEKPEPAPPPAPPAPPVDNPEPEPPMISPPPPEPQPEPQPQPQADLPQQRWDAHDLSMLKGCWLLGREVPVFIGTQQGIMRTAQLCFDESGHGRITQTSDFPAGTFTCTDSITGTFDDQNKFVALKPRTTCDNGRSWSAGTYTCTRQDDSTAICIAGGEGGRAELEFRRAP